MKTKLLKKIRRKCLIIPNTRGKYGFYIMFNGSKIIHNNMYYGSSYAINTIIEKMFCYPFLYFIKKNHELNFEKRKTNTILRRLAK